MSEQLQAASDAEVERWAETGTGYSLEAGVVRVVNGDAEDRYSITSAQAARLEQAAKEHGAGAGGSTPTEE